MSEIADLYDYQKSIEEQTENISSLRKQALAYQNDTSEYGMMMSQKISVDLAEAEKQLQETQYDKYIEDTQNMLDSLTQEYEDWMNARLDDEDALLKDIISEISNKGDTINDTLQKVANENGTFISDSITSIFNADSPFTSALTDIKTNTAGTIQAINNLVNTVAGITGTETKGNVGSGNSNTSGNSTTSNNTSTNTSVNNTKTANNGSSASSSNGYDNIFIYKKYSPQKLNIDTSLVDRLKYNNIDASWDARAKYWSKIFGSAYIGSDAQNVKFLNWLKSNGYKSGTSSASKGLHLWDEEGLGSELILTKEGSLMQFNGGEHVFSKDMVDNLWNLAQLNPISSSINMPDFSKLSNRPVSQDVNMNIGDVSVTLPNVTNYKEFRNELIKDSTFTNAMGTYVNNQIMHKNPLAHLQYSRR